MQFSHLYPGGQIHLKDPPNSDRCQENKSRAGQHTLISIFKEKQKKKKTYRWHHCCQMTVTWIQLKPSDLPGHYGEICPSGFLTHWGLPFGKRLIFLVCFNWDTDSLLASVPIKTLHTIPNLWFIPFTKTSHETYLGPCTQMTKWNANESQSWWCWGWGSHIIILQNKHKDFILLFVVSILTYTVLKYLGKFITLSLHKHLKEPTSQKNTVRFSTHLTKKELHSSMSVSK